MKKLICFMGLVSLVALVLAPATIAQAVVGEFNFGNGDLVNLGQSAGYGTATFGVVAGRIINAVFCLLGLCAGIIIIAAGFQWMSSGGDKEKIDGAKKLMTSALVGLIIVILAYAISTFVMSRLFNLTTA